MTNKDQIDIKNAASFLKVSSATIRNWIKQGLIEAQITENQLSAIREDLEKGKIERLGSRANKSKSHKTFIPTEYSCNKTINDEINQVITLCKEHFLSIEETIYNLVISFIDEKNKYNKKWSIERDIYQIVLDDYNINDLTKNSSFITKATPIFQSLKDKKCSDILGLIYQSLISEGEKSIKGSYYTPKNIIDNLVSDLDKSIKIFMDPCCGTGAFLMSAIELRNILPQNLYGADIDRTAVFIARVNILSHFKTYTKIPNIYHLDTLDELTKSKHKLPLNKIVGKIDAIATNPPWGANKNSTDYKELENILKSKEVFSMFILRSYDLLKKDGELNVLLPESVLKISTHRNIRKHMLTNSKIITIKEYGRAFKKVYSPVISIHLKKSKTLSNHKVAIKTKHNYYSIPQDVFLKTKGSVYEIKIDNEKRKLIEKIYSIPHKTLKNNAKWTLGIVTGNNNKHLYTKHTKGLEPIYRGSDIDFYRIKTPKYFINFSNSNTFQQVAKEQNYRANEKLIYKFISNKLVFAYDNKQSLTLNSANILIPNIPGMSTKIVLAFLNSSVFQFLQMYKFSTHKVLKGNLEELPFPKINEANSKRLIKLVDQAISGNVDVISVIDNSIFDIFGLNENEIITIKESIKST
ncbi:MAG: Eco57I restriction-modification methylase domain-containing protein [Bacteroidales bacterium]|nr:Eco57I restriction-modification methylase domain-containing protein [Bacteroidales bacterium]